MQTRVVDIKNAQSIGEGAYGEVFLIKIDGESRAIKVQYPSGKPALETKIQQSTGSKSSLSCPKKLSDSGEFQNRIDSIKREINALDAFASKPNQYIISHYDHYTVGDNNDMYIVMEYCPYGDLLNFRKENLKDIASQYHFIYCFWKGLNAIYELGFVHADIKPGNILVSREEDQFIPKICDFGLTRPVKEFTCAVPGTIIYCAPQLLNTKPEIATYNSFYTDVYSGGLVTYFAYFGKSHAISEKHYLSRIFDYNEPQLVDWDKFDTNPITTDLEMHSQLKKRFLKEIPYLCTQASNTADATTKNILELFQTHAKLNEIFNSMPSEVLKNISESDAFNTDSVTKLYNTYKPLTHLKADQLSKKSSSGSLKRHIATTFMGRTQQETKNKKELTDKPTKKVSSPRFHKESKKEKKRDPQAGSLTSSDPSSEMNSLELLQKKPLKERFRLTIFTTNKNNSTPSSNETMPLNSPTTTVSIPEAEAEAEAEAETKVDQKAAQQPR